MTPIPCVSEVWSVLTCVLCGCKNCQLGSVGLFDAAVSMGLATSHAVQHVSLCNIAGQPHVGLQADFIVPSSREAVDCDSAWNELLREQVPNLFLHSLQSFKQLALPFADQPMVWVDRWLQSIPLPREVHCCVALVMSPAGCASCTRLSYSACL